MIAGLALALMLAHAAAAPPAGREFIPDPQGQADWDQIEKDPDAAASLLAGAAVAAGCLMPFKTQTSAAAYTAHATKVGQAMKARSPKIAALPFTLEGVHGDTCQVTYHGAHVDELWKTFGEFRANPTSGDCTEAPATPGRIGVECKAAANAPAFRETIERAGAGITIAFTWLGSKAR